MEANEHDFRLFNFSDFMRSKKWGSTLRLEGMNPYDLHIANVLKDGESSIHRHNVLYNFIMCLSGEISIIFPRNIYNPTKSYSKRLKACQGIEIIPGVDHQFKAIEDSIILESYYSDPPKGFLAYSYFDIERLEQ